VNAHREVAAELEGAGVLPEDPAALRALPRAALPGVASALRAHLVRVGALVGGHFAGSLGAVELAVALHYVFETPRDRVVWDVGHQAYAHKALTGRREALRRVKRADGPSGFLRRGESPHDAFGAGHAGTSVSAALGFAEAAARRGDGSRAVAVLGDGGATAGMAFEALNHASTLGRPLKVVLNDNGMSIAPTVGGLARVGSSRRYLEALGWRVLGPVDGHDVRALVEALEELREATGPTALHARTRKGFGFAPAERDPYRWHATRPFDPETGTRAAAGGGGATWTAAFAEILSAAMERDPRVVALTAAMPDGTGLDRVAARHPGRVHDVGIAEQHAVTFAAGMAAQGLRPVCAIYSTFLQRAFDQIVHDVALQKLPVVFALDRAGLVGGDGPTHHGLLDLAYLRPVPNLCVAAPRDEAELAGLLQTALAGDAPFALRFPRGASPGVPVPDAPRALPLGRAEVLCEGDDVAPDVALFGLGRCAGVALEAAERLAERGLSAAVVDPRFAKPLDAEILARAARRTGRVVTIEDHAAAGGFGSAVLELLAREAPEARALVCGVPDRFVEHGDVEAQRRAAGIDPASVAERTAAWLAGPAQGSEGR